MNNDHSKMPAADSPPTEITETSMGVEARRRFLRASAVGGVVLLTLHNRAAWGGGKQQKQVCVSKNAWLSYNAAAPSAIERYENDAEQFEQFQAYQKTLNKKHWKQQIDNVPEGKICRIKK